MFSLALGSVHIPCICKSRERYLFVYTCVYMSVTCVHPVNIVVPVRRDYIRLKMLYCKALYATVQRKSLSLLLRIQSM